MRCTIIVTLIVIVLLSVDSMRVCKNFMDYYNPFSENCYNNPDDDSNITNIVSRWGFKVKPYTVTTADGYKLGVFRINYKNRTGTPVLLGHGVFMNSLIFVNRGNKSMAHHLAKHGYDVWLINFRGTRFSRHHTKLLPVELKYWDFSLHELAVYDTSATLKFMMDITKKKAIFIGFSLSSTISFIYTLTKNVEAQTYLQGVISMAPSLYFQNTRSLLRFAETDQFVLRTFVKSYWRGEAVPRSESWNKVCAVTPFMMRFCTSMMALSLGSDSNQLDPETLPISLSQDADSTSFKLLEHYVQIKNTMKFQQYNYSKPELNLKHYMQKTPPTYDFKKMSVPNTFFIGPNDILANEKNARAIYNQIPEKFQCGFHVLNYRRFSHTDFILAKDIINLFYDDLIEALRYLKENVCLKNKY